MACNLNAASDNAAVPALWNGRESLGNESSFFTPFMVMEEGPAATRVS